MNALVVAFISRIKSSTGDDMIAHPDFTDFGNNQLLLGGKRITPTCAIVVTLMHWDNNAYWIVPYLVSENIETVPKEKDNPLIVANFAERAIDAFLAQVVPDDSKYNHCRGYEPPPRKVKRDEWTTQKEQLPLGMTTRFVGTCNRRKPLLSRRGSGAAPARNPTKVIS